MTSTDAGFMGENSHDLRGRLSGYLGKQCKGPAGLSRLIGCNYKTAENILGGHWPRAEHLAAIVRVFRRDIIDAVFGPEIEDTVSRLEIEVRDLERQYHEKRALLKQAQSDLADVPQSNTQPAPLEARSFGAEP